MRCQELQALLARRGLHEIGCFALRDMTMGDIVEEVQASFLTSSLWQLGSRASDILVRRWLSPRKTTPELQACLGLRRCAEANFRTPFHTMCLSAFTHRTMYLRAISSPQAAWKKSLQGIVRRTICTSSLGCEPQQNVD